MNFIFKSRPKGPQELVKAVKEGLSKFESSDGKKNLDKVSILEC
jgi:hypothetical protein